MCPARSFSVMGDDLKKIVQTCVPVRITSIRPHDMQAIAS